MGVGRRQGRKVISGTLTTGRVECLTVAVPCVEVSSPANKLLYHSYHPRASSNVQGPGRQTDRHTKI